MSEDALMEIVPTVRFGRERRTHGYHLTIEGQNVRVVTKCGKPTLGREYAITHAVVSCPECQTSTHPVSLPEGAGERTNR